jgi:translation initiation factor IF-1
VPGEDAITVEGTVIEVLGDELFRAKLANGHELIAHPTRHTRGRLGGLGVGGRVRLKLSPFDMSKGRILEPPGGGPGADGQARDGAPPAGGHGAGAGTGNSGGGAGNEESI